MAFSLTALESSFWIWQLGGRLGTGEVGCEEPVSLALLFYTRNKRTLLGAPDLTTRSKDAIRGSWHRY